jgi:glutamate formiminotransferase/formiminotetrahydrofolate cyclodeaminase
MGGERTAAQGRIAFLVDEDTAAFNKVMAAFGLPKDSAEEKGGALAGDPESESIRRGDSAQGDGNGKSILRLLTEMATKGNPASISDVGVGLLATRACIEGAAMNVRINLSGLKDEKTRTTLQGKLERLAAESEGTLPDRPRADGEEIVVILIGARASFGTMFPNSTGSLDSARDDGRLSA